MISLHPMIRPFKARTDVPADSAAAFEAQLDTGFFEHAGAWHHVSEYFPDAGADVRGYAPALLQPRNVLFFVVKKYQIQVVNKVITA